MPGTQQEVEAEIERITLEYNQQNSAELIRAILTFISRSVINRYDTTVITQAQLNANSTFDRNRTNHVGTQLTETISDFEAEVTRMIDTALIGINAIIGAQGGDPDTFVNTVREIVQIFSDFPEEANVLDILSGMQANIDTLFRRLSEGMGYALTYFGTVGNSVRLLIADGKPLDRTKYQMFIVSRPSIGTAQEAVFPPIFSPKF